MKRIALVLLAAALSVGCSHKKVELHVFCWGDYISDEVLQGFAKESGCNVTLNTYKSNPELFAKLLAGGEGYDVCFVSDDFVQAFVDKGLLRKLDASKLPNRKNIAARHMGLPFDPKNEYTVPYFSGTTGIAFNRDKVNPAPASWKDLWNDKYKNRVSLVDDSREAIGAALRAEGKSINDVSPESLAKAKERLLAHKAYALPPESEPKQKLVRGDVWMCQCFSGDAIQARNTENAPPIEYIVPAEGGSIWIDSMAIPKSAKNPDLAHAFINYILRPDNAAKLANDNGYASPNEAARELINKEILGDPVANPGEDVIKRCEHLRPLAPDEKKRLDDLWAEVTAK